MQNLILQKQTTAKMSMITMSKEYNFHIMTDSKSVLYETVHWTFESEVLKELDLTEEEFLEKIKDGDIDPFEYSIEEDWEMGDSEVIEVFYEDATIA